MPWFRVDDAMPGNRKFRRVLRSHATKRRDVHALGLWMAAGAWSARELTDGFIPTDELDQWDDNGPQLAARLVGAELWVEATVEGEIGYQFVNWEEYNPTKASVEADRQARARDGQKGVHVRTHANKGIIVEGCEWCDPPLDPPLDPTLEGMGEPPLGPPTRPVPTRTGAKAPVETIDRFGEFWDTYDKKVGRKAAEAKWRIALRKPGVTAESLIAAAAAYITWQRSQGSHPQYTKNAATWLHGECWNDERVVRAPGQAADSRAAQWLRLAQEQETHPQIGEPS